jgi:hypothetical protein
MNKLLLVLGTLSIIACTHAQPVTFSLASASTTIHHPALFPETIAYNPGRDSFLVGSFREGAVFEINAAGDAKLLVRDERLHSVLGIAIDPERNRLWAVNADLGASQRPSREGPKAVLAVGIYDLTTGAALSYIDLTSLQPGPHLANGIALDATGNAYITDSFSPVIYKVDRDAHASVFLHDQRFVGDGINLNGLVVHPDGYLLVIKKSDGSLFKVPLAHPAQVSQVVMAKPIVGGDGLLLLDTRNLVIVANKTPAFASNAAFALSSDDDWATARVSSEQPLGDVYPTTAAVRGDKLFVIHSKLNELIQGAPDVQASLRTEATIRQIGRIR